MWFSSKHTKKETPRKGVVRFLRKGLATRREGRTIAGQSKDSRSQTGVFLLWLLLSATFFI
jgi:hypothetical protein